MRPFGSKRTYSKCIVLSAYAGKARKLKLTLKSRKSGRKINKKIMEISVQVEEKEL